MDEKIIVAPKYDQISWMHDGRVQVSRGKKYGIADSTGREIIPPVYQFVNDRFYNGLLMVQQDSKWGFADSLHHIVIPLEYDECRNFEKSITAVKRGKKFGFINRQHLQVTDFKYDFVGHQWDYDDKVQVVKNKKIGYLDESGQEVIPCEYDEESGFSPLKGHYLRKGNVWTYVK